MGHHLGGPHLEERNMIKVIATRKCAFGNGTRKPRFVFAEVNLLDENKIYALLKEVRDPANTDVNKLKTAKVKLSESVTFREFGMVLNNPGIMETVEATKAFADMNANEAIAAIEKMDAKSLAEAESEETAGKNRKSLIKAIDERKKQLETPSDDWGKIDVSTLGLDENIVFILDELEINTIDDVKQYADENEGLPKELSDEQAAALMAEIKKHAE